jgi:TolB protein
MVTGQSEEDIMLDWTKIAPAVLVASIILLGQSKSTDNFTLVPAIAFSSSRGNSCDPTKPFLSSEIYLMGSSAMDPMSPDPTNVQRLTNHNGDCTYGDLFAASSGDGKKIVFDSNRLRLSTDPVNTSDLFLMAADGSNQTPLIQGSSASWSPAVAENGQGSPESRQIVFHASASGTSTPIRPDPGAPTFDSDLFVLNVDECLQYLVQPGANCRDLATDITKDLEPDPQAAPDYNNGQFSPPSAPAIEEDAAWSPDGSTIVFTSHLAVSSFCSNPGTCNYPDTQIYAISPEGTDLTQLTHPDPNRGSYEKRAPAWSPDGLHIAYMCRIGPLNQQTGLASFELCVMNATGDGDGTIYTRLTANSVLDATPSWSPDGSEIVFHRNPPPFQLWLVKADTSCLQNPDGSISCSCPSGTYPASGKCEMQLTNTPGVMNGFPDWGEVRVHIPNQ